jgi:hypothetical protein
LPSAGAEYGKTKIAAYPYKMIRNAKIKTVW